MDSNEPNIALVALIIILVGVNIVLFVNGINLDCGKCVVKFTNHRVSGAVVNFPAIEVPAQELYDNFQNGSCPIKWERTRGFYKI